MSTQPCARCGAAIDPSQAAFSSDGLVCDACAYADQERDVEQMRAAEREHEALLSGSHGALSGPSFVVSHTRTETRHADGTVTTDESVVLDGWAARFFRALLGK